MAGPYLVVSLAGWAVGVELHPDSPVLLIHCFFYSLPRPEKDPMTERPGVIAPIRQVAFVGCTSGPGH